MFACNVFALMGLRQLFFLVDALLGKLVYLGYGLGVILSFIGIKLILEALHTNTIPFINGGRGIRVGTRDLRVGVAGRHRCYLGDHSRCLAGAYRHG